MNAKLKRALSLLLSLVLLWQAAPVTQAKAAEVPLPEVTLPPEVLANDVFYLASTTAALQEGQNTGYLLRVGRGGSAETESSVLVKISDVTAKYGSDYTVRVRGGGASVFVPQNNCSLLDRMANTSYEVTDLVDDEEAESRIADDPEAMASLKEQLAALTGDTDELDPVERARNLYTGTNAGTQSVGTTQDMMQDLQQMADLMTAAVPGAELLLTFAAGETEKQLILTPNDDKEGNGSRYFYVILSETEGSTTNSAVSTCAVTIYDDEEQTPSVLSFTQASYHDIEDGMVTVTVRREGAINTVVTATVRTTGGTAEQGRDYAGVDREILFPFGVDEVPLQIPVNTDCFAGSADFTLALEAGNGCTVENGAATVTLTGTYDETAAEEPVALRAGTVQNLTTIRLLQELPISTPVKYGNEDNYFGGTNSYNSGSNRWDIQWKDNSSVRDRKGTVGAVWQITEDELPVWIAGVRAEMAQEGGDPDLIIGIVGEGGISAWYSEDRSDWDYYSSGLYYLTDWVQRGRKTEVDIPTYSYRAQKTFHETLDIFPSLHALAEGNGTGNAPKYIGVMAHANDDNSDLVYVRSLAPILRPFVVRMGASDTYSKLQYLQADGTYRAASTSDIAMEIKDSVNGEIVLFLDDSVTVVQPNTSYARVTGFYGQTHNNIMKLTADASLLDSSAANYTFKLDKDFLREMFRNGSVGHAYKLNAELLKTLKNGTDGWFYNDSYSYNYPTYGEFSLVPTMDYIDAKVTLRNPFDFLVGLTISGSDYWLGPDDELELEDIHLGDTLAISDIQFIGAEEDYRGVGVNVRYVYNDAENDYKDALLRFTDGQYTYIGGKDGRLNCSQVVITPAITANDAKIVVRVKNSDLNKFDPAGFAGLPSEVVGDYTEYTYAQGLQVVNGRNYPLSAAPASENDVCVWTVNGGRRYVGGTFLFEGGRIEDPDENIIYLTAEPAAGEMKVVGTLNYMYYNLSTREAGGASTRPASGAAVMAGAMYGIVDEEGRISTTTMKVPANQGKYRVRCAISANGSSVVRDLALPSSGNQIDISSTFSSGLSPVLADIFNNVQLTASGAGADGLIPIGSSLDSTHVEVRIKPLPYTSYLADGAGGTSERQLYEKPQSVQPLILDQYGKLRYTCDTVQADYDWALATYVFSFEIPNQVVADDGETILYAAEPGDRVYFRLTTDLLKQAGDLDLPQDALDQLNVSSEDKDLVQSHASTFTYSEIYTGYTFYAPPTYVTPVKQGLQTPVDVTFATLPFLGDVGMNYNFPFVNVGYMKIDRGYRMYIGVSPLSIVDAVKGSMITKFKADDGNNWASLFAIGHPIETLKTGLKATYKQAFKNIGAGLQDVSSLGKRQWKIQFYLGVYFDFWTPKALKQAGDELINVSSDKIGNNLIWAGIGGYVSFNVTFKMAWYWIIPVVFIPFYIGVTIDGTAMGFLGASRDKKDPEIITYAGSQETPGIKFEDHFDSFNYCIQAVGMFEISSGVGLYGTAGVRIAGQLHAIGLYEPSELEDVRDWGAYLVFKLGFQVDLFLTSLGKMWDLKDLRYGKFEDWENSKTELEDKSRSTQAEDLSFRAGSEEDSEWLGNSTRMRGAFTPKQTYTLVENSYERADPQLITMQDGTVVLAYLANDPAKGPYQRTTLMLATYRDGVWSKPVPVSEDGTADFSPSIAEAKDGKVLVAWVSTEADDITEDTSSTDYLRQMEIYAAFAEIGADGAVTVGQTQRISHDRSLHNGTAEPEHYFDSNPTVVTDLESGDANIYYIKSAGVGETAADIANPYTNDSVICFLPYDGAKGKWMTDEFYPGELSSAADEQFLIDNFCGQRFLDSPTFDNGSGPEFYAIPDFTAIGYNGLAIYAYSVDRDSSNDTDADKELFLQVYSFKEHKTYYRIRLTNDNVADALPQFFRAHNAADDELHTKLFWYRNGDGVVYIDVTKLIQEGVNPDGSLIPLNESGSTYADPSIAGSWRPDANSAAQMADFRTAEDANGNLYVIWTEQVNQEDGTAAQEIFAISYYTEGSGEDGAENGNAGWSKPYQLTHSGLTNDEMSLTLTGEDLLIVHNQFRQTLGQSDESPLTLSGMRLVATTLEPCGSVETERVKLYADAGESETPVELPQPGQTVHAELTVINNGLTTADGYRAEVWQVADGHEKLIAAFDEDTRLLPNADTTLRFDWKLPHNLNGATLKVETRENHYFDRFVYTMEPLETRADYAFTNTTTYQAEDGFHLKTTVTNNGNAAGAPEDKLTVQLTGPFDLDDRFGEQACILYAEPIGSIGVGESKEIDVLVPIDAQMLEPYTFIAASVSVRRTVEVTYVDLTETVNEVLGGMESVEFSMTRPLNFTLNGGKEIQLAVDESKKLSVRMELAEKLGGSEVVYTVADPDIARIENGRLIGAAEGTTTVYATHVGTDAVVSVPVTVSGAFTPQENPFTDVAEDKYYYEPALWAYYHDPQITSGTGETTFSPNGAATRAQVVTFLWNAAGRPEPAQTENPFTDVPDGAYYTKPVLWAVAQGITGGTSETTFSPNRTCTRGQFATFLYRFARSPELADGTANPFSDVNDSSYYCTPVLWALSQGVTAGTSESTFSPNQVCTRGQIVTFLYRYMGEE